MTGVTCLSGFPVQDESVWISDVDHPTHQTLCNSFCRVFPGRVSQRGGHDRGRASPPRDEDADPTDAGGGSQGSREEEEGAGAGRGAQEAGGAAGAAGSGEESGAVGQREGTEER